MRHRNSLTVRKDEFHMTNEEEMSTFLRCMLRICKNVVPTRREKGRPFLYDEFDFQLFYARVKLHQENCFKFSIKYYERMRNLHNFIFIYHIYTSTEACQQDVHLCIMNNLNLYNS